MVATLGVLLARLLVTMQHIHLMLGRPERIQYSTIAKGHETHPAIRRLSNASQNCCFPCIRSSDDQCTEFHTFHHESITTVHRSLVHRSVEG
jgi:hypothetical protein